MDPYQILQVPKTFSLDQLKSQYKRIALQYHPDRHKNNKEHALQMFKVVTSCYKHLIQEYNKQINDKSHEQLKMTFTSFNQPKELPVTEPETKFNVHRFNHVFDTVKTDTHMDHGYDKWMKEDPKKAVEEKNKVVKYTEPKPVEYGLEYYTLGVKKISDFSGENMSSSGLHFMDYRVAHTTDKIIDPSKVNQRKEFKSVEDLKVDRSTVTATMSPTDLANYIRAQKKQEIKENKRIQTLKEIDEKQFQNHQRASQLMLKSS